MWGGGGHCYGDERRLFWWFKWDWKERVGSKMTPRLRILAEGVIMALSIFREKFSVERVRASGPMMIISDLLQFSLRKFSCIQFFISVRQVVRVEWVVAVMVLDGRYSCVSSA